MCGNIHVDGRTCWECAEIPTCDRELVGIASKIPQVHEALWVSQEKFLKFVVGSESYQDILKSYYFAPSVQTNLMANRQIFQI